MILGPSLQGPQDPGGSLTSISTPGPLPGLMSGLSRKKGALLVPKDLQDYDSRSPHHNLLHSSGLWEPLHIL